MQKLYALFLLHTANIRGIKKQINLNAEANHIYSYANVINKQTPFHHTPAKMHFHIKSHI